MSVDDDRAIDAEISALWIAYKQDHERRLRDQLILHYSPLVKYVAGRVAVGLPQNVEQADLVSYGIFGLIDAIEKFDLGRGFKFETYAISRIKGAILDGLRAIDWVPRSVRAKARAIEQAYRQARERRCTARRPTRSWPTSSTSASGSCRRRSSQISFVGIVALDEMLSAGDRAASRRARRHGGRPGDGPARVRGQEMRHMLAEAITDMPEREKNVLTLYYYEGLTLAQIGEVLGVTESRVCQIHTKAILQLRSRSARLGPRAGLNRGTAVLGIPRLPPRSPHRAPLPPPGSRCVE